MPVLRQVIGETLRGVRLRQQRTLREVSAGARVSLGYLSEVERGRKEPSSELLAAICAELDVDLSDVFAEVSRALRREEKLAADRSLARLPAGPPRLATGAPRLATGETAQQAAALHVPVAAGRPSDPAVAVRTLPTLAA